MGCSSGRRCRELNHRGKNCKDCPKDIGSGLSAVTCLRVNTPGATGTVYPHGVLGYHKRLNEVAKWAKNPRGENIEGDRSQELGGTSPCLKREQS
jgi:hypothetical protein